MRNENGIYSSLLKEHEKEQIAQNPYAKFGFLENPFPTKAHVMWKRFYNQEEFLREYNLCFRDFFNNQKTNSFLILGGNRTGKTHFLMHHSQKIQEENVKENVFLIAPIYITATSADFHDNYRDILDQLEAKFREAIGSELLPELIRKIQKNPDIITKVNLIEDDFVRGILNLPFGEPKNNDDPQITKLQEKGFDLMALFRNWLRGASTLIEFRQALNMYSVPKSPSAKIRLLGDLIKTLRAVNLLRGVILFIDELEQIWLSGIGKQKRERYLILLRALLDECQDSGLLMVVALSTEGGIRSNFEREYVPLYKRLASASEEHILRQIDSYDDAWGYIEYFRDKARKEYNQRTHQEFTGQEIITKPFVIETITGDDKSNKFPILQGDLFDKFHQVVENLIQM
ncbi:MAG: hypothetical protein QME81_05610 [bacterium]|nr:hypothetical protein [bacterium]